MAEAAEGEKSRAGLYVSVKNTLATLLTIARTRLELLTVELAEEKRRLLSIGAKAAAAVFLFQLGLVMAVCCLAVVFWEYRALVFGLLAALFIGGGVLLAVSLKRQAAQPGKLFSSSLSELEADIALLRQRQRPE
jgi:uncharacterized membrane protein YqjE